MVRVKAKYLWLLNRFRSNEDAMDAIACFHIRPCEGTEGVLIEALNGHQYGVFHDKDGVCDIPSAVFKPTPGLLKAFKPSKMKVGRTTVTVEPELVIEHAEKLMERGEGWEPLVEHVSHAVRVENGHNVVLYIDPRPEDCLKSFQWPRSEGFWAKRESALAADVSLNGVPLPVDHVGQYDFGDGSSRVVSFHPTGLGSPVFVTVSSHPEFLGIVMPMMDERNSIDMSLDKPFLPRLHSALAKQYLESSGTMSNAEIH